MFNNFILCLEMFIFSFVHAAAFPAAEFEKSGPMPSNASALQNITTILSVKDVIDDAYHNFMPAYNDYVLHKAYEGAPDKVFKARTFIIGNIDGVKVDEGLRAKIREAEESEIELIGRESTSLISSTGKRGNSGFAGVVSDPNPFRFF
jgi:hypothetical protein